MSTHMSSTSAFLFLPSSFSKDGDGGGKYFADRKSHHGPDVASLRASVSHVGSVSPGLQLTNWTPRDLWSPTSGRSTPKQTENGNFPRVTWPKGVEHGARRPCTWRRVQGLSLADRGPQAAWGCHSVTRKSSVSQSCLEPSPQALRSEKSSSAFLEESGFNVAVHKQGDKLFFLLQGPFLHNSASSFEGPSF